MFDWLRQKQTPAQSGILAGLTDIHTHILPGVDDGIASEAEALKALEAYEAFGIGKVVLTPHIMEDYPQNTSASLRQRFERFKAMYKGSVELSLGAEYMLDNNFGRLLDSGDVMPVAGRYLLVETAFMSPPLNLAERLDEIRAKGYFVVLAHPERYAYMRQEEYRKLKEMGVLFQLNLLSIVGGYGKSIEEKAKRLLRAGHYNFIGTDIHNLGHHCHLLTNSKLGRREIKLLMELKNRSLI